MVVPKVEPLFELRPLAIPKVRTEASHVVVRFEVHSVRNQLDARDLEISLSGEYAGVLGWELIENARRRI